MSVGKEVLSEWVEVVNTIMMWGSQNGVDKKCVRAISLSHSLKRLVLMNPSSAPIFSMTRTLVTHNSKGTPLYPSNNANPPFSFTTNNIPCTPIEKTNSSPFLFLWINTFSTSSFRTTVVDNLRSPFFLPTVMGELHSRNQPDAMLGQ